MKIADAIEMRPDVSGKKLMKDGSQRFTFHGGPYDGGTFRVYPPYEDVVFPQIGTARPRAVYRLHEPIRKNGKWVFTLITEANEVSPGLAESGGTRLKGVS